MRCGEAGGGGGGGGVKCTLEREEPLRCGFCPLGHRKSEKVFGQGRLDLELLLLAAGSHGGEMSQMEKLGKKPHQWTVEFGKEMRQA